MAGQPHHRFQLGVVAATCAHRQHHQHGIAPQHLPMIAQLAPTLSSTIFNELFEPTGNLRNKWAADSTASSIMGTTGATTAATTRHQDETTTAAASASATASPSTSSTGDVDHHQQPSARVIVCHQVQAVQRLQRGRRPDARRQQQRQLSSNNKMMGQHVNLTNSNGEEQANNNIILYQGFAVQQHHVGNRAGGVNEQRSNDHLGLKPQNNAAARALHHRSSGHHITHGQLLSLCSSSTF